jgi:hypothetical protein
MLGIYKDKQNENFDLVFCFSVHFCCHYYFLQDARYDKVLVDISVEGKARRNIDWPNK